MAEVVPTDGLPFLDEVRRALKNRRKVRISYRSSTAAEAKGRVIRPYGMVAASGMWYVVAYCEASEGLRVFRADRIEDATLLADRYEIAASFSIRETLREGRALQTDTPSGGMTVRYSRRIARWIAEREGRELSPDGSLTIEHPLADAEWGVRHVLQYGPEAEVLEPQSLREEIVRRLASLGSRENTLSPGSAFTESAGRLNASQAVFAHCLNVSPKLVQAWEAHRREPDGAALRLLRLAEHFPALIFAGVTDRPRRTHSLGRSRSRKAARNGSV